MAAFYQSIFVRFAIFKGEISVSIIEIQTSFAINEACWLYAFPDQWYEQAH